MKRRLSALLIMLSVLINAVSLSANAEGEARLYADDISVYKGNSASVFIKAENLENIGAMDFSVHYDSTVFSVNDAYVDGLASGSFSDVNITGSSVNFSLVSTDAVSGSGNVGCLNISVPSDASAGVYTVNITVGDVYDTGLLPVSVSGGSFTFTVKEYTPAPYRQRFNVYARSYGSYTEGDTVEVSFDSGYVERLGTLDLLTEYDQTLLRLDSVTLCNTMAESDSALWSINDTAPGFVKTSYIAPYGITGSMYPVITYSFTVIANVDDSAIITLCPQNVCDTDRMPMDASDATAVITLYETVEEPVLPSVSAVITEDDAEYVTVDVTAEKDTNIAAGDFTVSYDAGKLTCESAGRINTGMVVSKIRNDEGKVTFSFILDGGISSDTGLCRLVFKKSTDAHSETEINISGKNTVDDDLIPVLVEYKGLTVTVHDLTAHGTCTGRPKCPVCGIEFGDPDPDNHDFGEWIQTKAPACTEKGEETRYCSRCDATEIREVEALGHDLVHHDAKAATCTEIGWNEYDTCSRCDYTTYEEITATGHTPAEPVRENEAAATCSAEGHYDEVVYCTVCHEELSRTPKTIEKIAHTPGEAVRENEVPAACTTEGHYDEVVYCAACGEELSRTPKTIAALGHNFGEWAVTTQPTCTEKGVETRICSRCDATEIREVAALGHDYAASITAPTCTAQGYTTHTCSRCGDSYVDTYVAALGHDWGEAVYEWSADNGSVTASRICNNDHSHIEHETVVTSSETMKEATYVSGKLVKYEAEFENGAFEKQCKYVTLDNEKLPAEKLEEEVYVKINHSCTLTDNLALNYYFTIGENGAAYGEYENVKLIIEKKEYYTGNTDGYEIKVYEIEPTRDTQKGYSRYRFSFRRIMSYMIGDDISAVFYGEKDGKVYVSEPDTFNVKQYAYSVMGLSSTKASLKTLLADLLNYGSLSQIYFGYNVVSLVNTEMTDAQKAYATQNDVVLEGERTYLEMQGTPRARFTTNSAVLDSTIELKYYMTFDSDVDMDNVTLVLEYHSIQSGDQTIEISGSEFVYDSAKSRYSAKLTTMASYDIGQQVRATLYEGDEQISDTQLTSVEIYAKSMLEYYTGLNDNKYDTLINLLRGMIKYTRAAKNYFTNS